MQARSVPYHKQPLSKRARDALFAYIKGGNALRGAGSRLKLAYVIDPSEKRITEVFLRTPHKEWVCRFIMDETVVLEQHHVPWGPHATYVCADQFPEERGVQKIPSQAFKYRQQTKSRNGVREWVFYGRGVVTSIDTNNGRSHHCTAPHTWLLDTFEFYCPILDTFKPASYFYPKVLTGVSK